MHVGVGGRGQSYRVRRVCACGGEGTKLWSKRSVCMWVWGRGDKVIE